MTDVKHDIDALAGERWFPLETNRIVCCKSEQIHDVDMDEGLEMTKHIDPDQFRVLRAMTR